MAVALAGAWQAVVTHPVLGSHACCLPRRHTPGRGVTPRKSSLRRTASADSMEGARQPLGSHPLRRQSSGERGRRGRADSLHDCTAALLLHSCWVRQHVAHMAGRVQPQPLACRPAHKGSLRHLLSHPAAVSWAEELESIKEIQPHAEGSPDGTARWLHAVAADSQLRTRLAAAAAAAGQQPPAVVLAACLLALMMVAVVERMLLSSLL